MFSVSFEHIYNSATAIIIVTIVLVLIFIFFYVFPQLVHMLLFHPKKITQKEFDDTIYEHRYRTEAVTFESNDDTKLSGILINYYKKPSWDDKIFLYSHGNSGLITKMFWCKSVKMLSKFGSVFAYDYRGYGTSDGSPTKNGCYSDILGAWDYLTNVRNIDPKKIVIFGHSLGSVISTNLVRSLIDSEEKKLPAGVVLWAPFISIGEMANLILFKGASILSPSNMDNLENLEIIDGKVRVLILHSKDDETIPFSHSVKLNENTKSDFIEITGTHCELGYNNRVLEYIKKLTSGNPKFNKN